MNIPVCEPALIGNEKKYLTDCVESGWISSDGPYVKKFEEQFSSYIGTKYGVAVNNGTSALSAAIFALNIGDGDEVILPSFTIISCALAVVRHGCIPVLVDIEPETWNIDVNKIEERITKRTKAIMAVHMYGHPVDMDPILELAKKYNLYVIEDASQVHGAQYKGRRCGSIGDIATFSFYANKILTTGEGGMVVTSSQLFADRALNYRNLCFDIERKFNHEELGDNLRMTNMQAAIGVAQLENIDKFIAIKKSNGRHYAELLTKVPGVKFQIEKEWASMVYWMYCLQLDDSIKLTVDDVRSKLAKQGIGTRPFFRGMHQQPALHKKGLFRGECYPITEHSHNRGLYLPSSIGLTERQIDYIVNELSKILVGG